MTPFDILIKNARILDGSGSPAQKADIGIRDGKFTAIMPGIPADQSDYVIDGSGLVAAPGFIDVHTHDDLYLLRKPNADEKILQGITTVITGNCGFSPAPLVQNGRDVLKSFDGLLGGGPAVDLFGDRVSFGEFLDMLEDNRPGLNVGALVGNVTVRIGAMQHDMRPPTKDEMAHMKSLVAEAMESGAFGFSTGLVYAPGSYAQTPELIELASIAASYGGIYTTHMRNEGETLLESIQEAIQVAETSGVRVEISHLKAAGKSNWGKSSEAIALIKNARERGLEITADQYPYNAGSTGLFALLPPDVLAGGLDSLSIHLQEPAFRRELRARLEDAGNSSGMMAENSFDRIQIASSPNHPNYEGKTLEYLASSLQVDPLDLVFDLVAEEKLQVTMVTFSMDDGDIRRIMQTDFVMMGSDGLPSLGSRIHPRMSGTAPRILGHYSREQHVLKLEEAVRKMTSLPAATFRLEGKGLLKEGFDADLVLFDPDQILDQATYENPTTPPVGIAHVLVNGVPAVEQGRVLGTRAGKVLRYAE
ncbi:MAG: D-aminoacylase [Chloroflexi bacterium]|nr:D-aminoacylase [Chloroflexota bacterium]